MFISKLKKILRPQFRAGSPQMDIAAIKIGDVLVTMARRVNSTVPHEFSVYVPRVEIRQRFFRDDQLQYEKEMIFNSLTIVHAPQHPPADSGRVATVCQKMD
ncbi:hypothetical protein [Sporotomaculum syntrophicum]|nr:hypothetical protein [Sporotomaculum syntrophicum]